MRHQLVPLHPIAPTASSSLIPRKVATSNLLHLSNMAEATEAATEAMEGLRPSRVTVAGTPQITEVCVGGILVSRMLTSLIGFFGGQQQQPQVVYQQAPPKKSGPGMGTALLAGRCHRDPLINSFSSHLFLGGAGLVGGALLADAFEDHEDREEREAYDAGYQDGQDNDYGGGDDW